LSTGNWDKSFNFGFKITTPDRAVVDPAHTTEHSPLNFIQYHCEPSRWRTGNPARG
jgi:hypothetical protein